MSYDPVDLHARNKQQAESEQRRKLERETEEGDVRWLMGSKRGRRIVWRFLERAGVFRSSFNSNSMTMAFNEGMRNEGLRMIATIHSCCPDLHTQMVREANERNADDGNGRNDHGRPDRDHG